MNKLVPIIALLLSGSCVGHILGAAATATGGSRLAAGRHHGLRVATNGTVYQWTGAHPERAVEGLPPVSAVAAGAMHSLALTTSGRVWAWGLNGHGQLGDGSRAPRSEPFEIEALSGVIAIAAGESHSLALTDGGLVWAWGAHQHGQLGDGAPAGRLEPALVPGLGPIVALGAGYHSSFAIAGDETVWAWGRNDTGQLGDGTTENRAAAVLVSGLTGVAAIAGGATHTLAVKADGSLWAWGGNAAGELGVGSRHPQLAPVQTTLPAGVVAAGAGTASSIALLSDGTVWTWGTTLAAPLNDPTGSQTSTPALVPGLHGIVAVGLSQGAAAMVAATAEGQVYFWGGRQAREWLGEAQHASLPAVVPGISDVESVAVSAHVLAVQRDGSVWAWGPNDHGQLGDTDAGERLLPARIEDFSGLARTTTGQAHSHGLKRDGSLWSWGDNTFGQRGDWATAARTTPAPVTLLQQVSDVAAGGWHTVAVESGGAVWSWGLNDAGQLGDGTRDQSQSPVRVREIPDARTVAAGLRHSLAAAADGSVWTWGDNTRGQLGADGPASRLAPARVQGLNGILAVAAGEAHSLALSQDGTLWAWGANDRGQLGNGATADSATPVRVGPVSGRIVAIAAGRSHSLALTFEGVVWAWGANDRSQLGIAASGDRPSPVRSLLPGPVSFIAAGESTSLAAVDDGALYAWGDNLTGALGLEVDTLQQAPESRPARDFPDLAIAFFLPNPSFMQFANITFIVSNVGGAPTSGPAQVTIELPAGATFHQPGTRPGWTCEPGQKTVICLYSGSIDTGQSVYGEVLLRLGPATFPSFTMAGRVHHPDDRFPGNDVAGGVARSFAVVDPVPAGRAAASRRHSLMALPNGTIWAWGANSTGQLGDGGGLDPSGPQPGPARDRPAPVHGLDAITAVAAGDSHSLALRRDGVLFGWGSDTSGQLASGVHSPGATFAIRQIPGMSGVTAITAAGQHSLAVKRDGTVWAWGSNEHGQLGDGTRSLRRSPVQVEGLSGVIAIATSEHHSLALRGDGTVWAWGSGATGILGNGQSSDQLAPVQVVDLQAAVAIAAGGHSSLAITVTGGIRAWGNLVCGLPTGDFFTDAHTRPREVWWLTGVTAIAANANHCLAARSDGSVWAWGLNDAGQVGNGSSETVPQPVQVARPGGSISLDAGPVHSLAITSTGIAYAWGQNDAGQVGTGPASPGAVPGEVDFLDDVVSIAAGQDASLAIERDGTLWAWGANHQGSLTPNAPRLLFSPAPTGLPGPFETVSASYLWLARDATGGIWSSIGPQCERAPCQIPLPSPAKAISAGANSGAALLDDGGLWQWNNGGLPISEVDNPDFYLPARVAALDGLSIVAIDSGATRTLAVTATGRVWSWGEKEVVKAGNEWVTLTREPHELPGLLDVVAASAGGQTDAVLHADGTASSWGLDGFNHAQPTRVPGLSGITALSSGEAFHLALRNDGTVWVWGYTQHGESGTGETVRQGHTPIQVPGLADIVTISAGSTHCLALGRGGRIYSWGDDAEGKLGRATGAYQLTPTRIRFH